MTKPILHETRVLYGVADEILRSLVRIGVHHELRVYPDGIGWMPMPTIVISCIDPRVKAEVDDVIDSALDGAAIPVRVDLESPAAVRRLG